MSTTEILRRIREFVTESFLYMRPDFQLGDSDPLLGNGVIDSMGVMELTEFLAAEFQIEVGDAEITERNLGTLQSITRYVDSKRAARDLASCHSVGAG